MNIPNTVKIEKYAKRNFKAGRLKKKQVSVLRKAYSKMCKRYGIRSVSLTLIEPMEEREIIACKIAVGRSSIETMSRKDSIPVVPCLPCE